MGGKSRRGSTPSRRLIERLRNRRNFVEGKRKKPPKGFDHSHGGGLFDDFKKNLNVIEK
jgi:hypothetical protein